MADVNSRTEVELVTIDYRVSLYYMASYVFSHYVSDNANHNVMFELDTI